MRAVVSVSALGACLAVDVTLAAAQSGRPVIASTRDLPPIRDPMPSPPSELALLDIRTAVRRARAQP
ncbi:MAG: hypothetical protein K2X61_15040 [Caulobacteraceae bacterium]|nr:hypothetical protein [Caulobacteraceae bacterium]